MGAQGGFNSDNFFSDRYNKFFEEILIEPINTEAEKLKNEKYIINKGLWSKKENWEIPQKAVDPKSTGRVRAHRDDQRSVPSCVCVSKVSKYL